MAFWRKDHPNPIDRAVEDLERKIASLQQQVRVAETGRKPLSPVAAKAELLTKFVKEILTPPPQKSTAMTGRVRRDLFDTAADPLKDLEVDSIAFAAQPAPDLFAHAATAQRIDCAPKADEKFAIYISAGSLKGFKKPLRVEQRRNRNRFLMWIGLGFVALWFIWAVVR
jgi:hypothetical protein